MDQSIPGKCLFVGGTLDGEWHTPARTTVNIPVTQPVSVGEYREPFARCECETYSHWVIFDMHVGRVDLMVESQLSENELELLLNNRGFRIRNMFLSV